MSFDPDAYLKADNAPSFDPDAYLGQESSPKSNPVADAARRFSSEAGATGGQVVSGIGSAQAAGTDLIDQAQVAIGRLLGAPEHALERLKQRQAEQRTKADAGLTGKLQRGGEFVSDAAREAYDIDPARNDTIVAKLAQGAGSLPVAIASGPAAPIAVASMMGQQGKEDARQALARRGITDPEEIRKAETAAFGLNAPIGAVSEHLLGVPALLRSAEQMIGKTAVARIARQAGLGFAREGAQEGIEQATQNVVAKDVVGYDPERDRSEGVVESALLGGLIGGPTGAAFQGVQELDARAGHKEFAQQLDTAKNIPESTKTLLLQQDQLRRGLRPAQMFPAGTKPLPLIDGMEQVKNERGVFHYNPQQVTEAEILNASSKGRENDVLGLGSVSKPDAEARAAKTGEPIVAVTERAADGTEIKTAVGTTGTAAQQTAELNANKSPGSTVKVESPRQSLIERLRADQAAAEQTNVAAALAEAARRDADKARRDGDKARFEETLLAADALSMSPEAEWPAVNGALTSLSKFVDDPTYALTQQQKEAALKRIAGLKPRAEQLKVAHDVATDARFNADKAAAAAAEKAKQEKVRADQARIDAIDATGRDPATNRIVQIENLTDDDLADVGNDLESNGLTPQRYEAELMRRERQAAEEGNRANFTLRDLFVGKKSALNAAGLTAPLRLPTPKTETERGGLGGELKTLRESSGAFAFFQNNAPALDRMAQTLRGLGFKVQTENDVIELVGHAFNGEDVRPQTEGEVEFATSRNREGEIYERVNQSRGRLVDLMERYGHRDNVIESVLEGLELEPDWQDALAVLKKEVDPNIFRAAKAYWSAAQTEMRHRMKSDAKEVNASQEQKPALSRDEDNQRMQAETEVPRSRAQIVDAFLVREIGNTRELSEREVDGFLAMPAERMRAWVQAEGWTQLWERRLRRFWRENRSDTVPASKAEEAMIDRRLRAESSPNYEYRIERSERQGEPAGYYLMGGEGAPRSMTWTPIERLGGLDVNQSIIMQIAVNSVRDINADADIYANLSRSDFERKMRAMIQPMEQAAVPRGWGSIEADRPAAAPEPVAKNPAFPRVAEFFKRIAGQDNAWQFGRAQTSSKDLAVVAAGFSTKKIGVVAQFDARTANGSIRTLNNETKAEIGVLTFDLTGKRVKVYSGKADSNRQADGGGKNMYQALFTWAHNNGYRVLGDSLTPVNQVRRTVNMLSSALRHDTTNHIIPYSTQDLKGWIEGDTDNNIGVMVAALSKQMSARTKGGLDALTYDPKSDTVVNNVTGEVVTNLQLRRIVEDAKFHENGFGPSTIRAILAARAELAAHARGEGYNPADAENAARDGTLRGVLYASRANGGTGATRPGADGRPERKLARALPAAQPLSDVEVERLRAAHAKALGPRIADLDLRVGLLADLLEQEGYPKAAANLRANKLGEAEAVVAARRAPQLRAEIVRLRQEQAFLLVSAKAAAEGKMTGLIAHELAHRYWDTLPEDAKAIERATIDQALKAKSGPLFDAEGNKRTNIAITAEELRAAGRGAALDANPDLVYQEYFAELTRLENERYLGNRVDATSAPAHTRRLIARLRQWLQEVFDAVRRTTGQANLSREGFREWLAGASQEQTNRTALAYATRQGPKFATIQSTFDMGGMALGLDLPNTIRNLTPRWQDKVLRFDSNLDKALYYAGGEGKTETRTATIEHLTRETGLSPGQIATLARDLRQKLAPLARNTASEGTLRVPPQMQAAARQLTGVQFSTSLAVPKGNVDAETNEPDYVPTVEAMRYARAALGRPKFDELLRERFPTYEQLDGGTQINLVEPIAREAVAAAQQGRDPEQAIRQETAKIIAKARATAKRAGRLSIYDIEPGVDFATSEADGLFNEDTAGDANRSTTGDFLAAADKFREETTEVPKGSPLDNREVRLLAPYLISGNKGDIVGAHGDFIAKVAQGAKRVVDAFGGAAIYSHFLADRGLLPAGSQWNEWEYTRSTTNRQIATNTEAVVAALDQVKADYLAAFPREKLPVTREEMLDLRRRQLDWMQERVAELVPTPSKDAEGRLILPDSPQMAAFYLFAQNHMAENRVVDIELRNGRAVFTTAGKVNGKDDFKFIAADKNGKPEWAIPWMRIWEPVAAANRLRAAAGRLRQLEVRQGDGWALAANAEPGSLVFVDSSYFQSDKDIAEGKQVMNYGSETLDDGNWPDWLVKFAEKLEPRGNDVRYVVTNNFNNQVVAELEKAGWTILRTSRTNKTGLAHELVALSPAAARAAGIQPQPTRTAPPAAFGIRRGGRPLGSSRGRPAADTGAGLALSGDRDAGPVGDRPNEIESNQGNAAGNGRGEGDRGSRAAELKANLPAGVKTAAQLEAEQATLSEPARNARHPAAVGTTEPGEAWASVARMTESQLAEEFSKIAEHLSEYALDLADIEKALLHGRRDAIKAEQARRTIDQAQRVTAIPVIDRQAALKTELARGRRLRDDGLRTGNELAQKEGIRIVKAATARLDEEFPNWEVTSKPAVVKDSLTTGSKAAPASLVEQDDGRNLPPPAPPQPPENGPAQPDEAAPDRGRARAAFGHSAYTPSFLEKITERVRSMAVGFRGAIPELPAFPALAAKTDRFIRDQGPTFYNNLKAFYRTLSSANDYIQRTAEEQVDAITGPLMKAGPAFDATAYARLKQRQEQARRLKAEGKRMPAGAAAELDALQSQLEAHPYVLFNKLVYFMDLDWRSRNLKDSEGNPIKLPDGLNQTELTNEINRLGGLIAASPHAQAIETAFDRHMAMVKRTADDLKERDLLAAQHLDNPYYFPHLTLEITRGDKTIERELRPERVRVGTEADFRGYLQEPTGSLKPIESDYVRALYYHLVQIGAHNLKADAIRDHARPYDMRAQVEARAKELSKQRGRSVSWEEVFHSEYAPAGYVLYGTDSRDAFPSVMVDRDKLARRLGEALTSADLHAQLKELGVKGIKLLPEDLKETLVQGQRETWIVPARVAEALRGIADRQKKTSEPIESAIKKVNGAWKGWKLFMPQNHIRYEYGNIVADLEKLFSASPRTFKYIGQSAKEMRAFFQGEAPSADLRFALKKGVINANTAQEMEQLQRLRAFEKFQTVGDKIWMNIKRRSSSVLYQPITNLVGLGDLSSVELSAFREGVTRYANYLANLDAIRNNARPDYAGAYWRDIEAIGDSRPGAADKAQLQAAQISKATFGDYPDISTNGQYIRDKLIPFYSWMEVNFKYHANLLRNFRDQVRGDIDGGSTNAAATVARVAGARAGGFALRLALPYAAILLWNAMGPHGVEDDDLSEEDRRKIHIRLGKDANGKPQIMYANTALADVTKWFSGAKFAQASTAWLTGKTDFVTALDSWAREIPGDFVNNTLGSAGPIPKVGVALAFKKATFPDVLDARTIPDYDLRRAVVSQMTDDFTAEQIERTINKDYLAPKDLGTWAKQLVLQVRQRDPESWAFYGIKDKAAEWVEKRTGQSRDSSYNAPDQQVLRNFRKAIYQGDPETAAKFYLRLLDLGYTAERFTASIRAQEPLAGVPKDLRRDFVASLSEGDQAQLDRAYQFYVRMSTSKGTEQALFPRKEWGERGQQYYQANPRVEVLNRTMQRTETMADEELVARAKWEMKRSLMRN